jgi:hypothetical protein
MSAPPAPPTIEDTVAYLQQTHYNEVILAEFKSRREALFLELDNADQQSDLWKAVGAIRTLDELIALFSQSQ